MHAEDLRLRGHHTPDSYGLNLASLPGFTHPARYIGWLHMNAGALPVTLQATGEQIVPGCNVKYVPSL